ncbi:MAG: type II toxin-antitoxin system RelE/ParE family toxin [Lachnospiraceae bacterium]|nr:type II toxin-antitoxin system RelE/ParE family toxin [Lachnospiraceae bacterium]
MNRYTTVFYKKADGEEPAKDFLLSLDYKMRAKMLRMLEMLQLNGPALRLPYSEELEDGIFELRTKVGSDITRLLYFYDDGKLIILSNGFVKKSRKTPEQEKALAKKYRNDYLARKEQT